MWYFFSFQKLKRGISMLVDDMHLDHHDIMKINGVGSGNICFYQFLSYPSFLSFISFYHVFHLKWSFDQKLNLNNANLCLLGSHPSLDLLGNIEKGEVMSFNLCSCLWGDLTKEILCKRYMYPYIFFLYLLRRVSWIRVTLDLLGYGIWV